MHCHARVKEDRADENTKENLGPPPPLSPPPPPSSSATLTFRAGVQKWDEEEGELLHLGFAQSHDERKEMEALPPLALTPWVTRQS